MARMLMLRPEESRHGFAFIAGVVIGAISGALVTLVLTPMSSSDMREKLRHRDGDIGPMRERAIMPDPIRWAEAYFENWAHRLSPEAKQAIHYYQRNQGAAELNGWYRRGIQPQDLAEAQVISGLLDRALSEVQLETDIVVYRGVGPRDRERFPDAVMEALASAGGIIEDRGYLSTSLDRSVSISEYATDQGTVYELLVPAGAYASYLGQPLVCRAGHRYQAEMLFPRGSHMVVRSVEYGRHGVARWITLELQ